MTKNYYPIDSVSISFIISNAAQYVMFVCTYLTGKRADDTYSSVTILAFDMLMTSRGHAGEHKPQRTEGYNMFTRL